MKELYAIPHSNIQFSKKISPTSMNVMHKAAAATTVLEHCEVAPPPDAKAEQLLLLTHSDIWWFPSMISKIVLFYEIPCSKTHFIETIVPNLKNSLSLTLKHFLPMAGKLFLPLDSGLPVCRYTKGDSVPVTIAISGSDFIHLTGNHAREANEFDAFVSELQQPIINSSIFIKIPHFAIQITLFPNQGISIGYTIHHSMVDGATTINFLKAWGSITKSNGDDIHGQWLWLPFYDRSSIRDPNGLDSIRWNQIKMLNPTSLFPTTTSIPTNNNNLRATFVLSKACVQKLKEFVLDTRPKMAHVSSFSLTCAYVWISLVKSRDVVVDEGEPEFFVFVADCRGRFNPPLPSTYFGNCLAPMKVELGHGKLIRGNEGFLAAVEAIGEVILKTVYNEKGILDSLRNISVEEFRRSLVGKRTVYVAGSPRIEIHDVDFGWGNMKKYESVSTNLSISICKSRGVEEGLEFSFSCPKIQMDAFAAIFNNEIEKYGKGLSWVSKM